MLTPSKRRKITSTNTLQSHEPTTTELWKWTLTNDAVAPCFIVDALSMRANDQSGNKYADNEFFWLGRVPCRNVSIVGMIVGVQVYEKRITYTVDDGSAVIECAHKPIPPPTSPKKSPSKKQTKPLKPKPKSPPLPKPIGYVGTCVKLRGKVAKWHDSRQIIVTSIERTRSANDEVAHWRRVIELHSSHYDLDEPFTIPTPSHADVEPVSSHDTITFNSTSILTQFPASHRRNEPKTPSSSSRSNYPSPASAVSKASSTKSTHSSSTDSPHCLRHPSRLRSRDLTDNTFRLYMKHYLWHLSTRPDTLHDQSSDTDSEDEDILNRPTTPTRHRSTPRKHEFVETEDESRTPRPSQTPLWTPKARPKKPIRALVFGSKDNALNRGSASPSQLDGQEAIEKRAAHGVTLSYLRRVPELAHLARRVVKQRYREERKKSKGEIKPSKGPVSSRTAETPREHPREKSKRLFRYALLKLYEEGDLVLHDGPTRPLLEPHAFGEVSMSGIWKSAESSTVSADSTLFSAGGTSQLDSLEEDGEDQLSDPPVGEEAYIPVTPAFLADHVEDAIQKIYVATARKLNPSSNHTSSIQRAPTKSEITQYLRRTDARWSRVGEWAVEESLTLLNEQGRIWTVGGGRWEVCL